MRRGPDRVERGTKMRHGRTHERIAGLLADKSFTIYHTVPFGLFQRVGRSHGNGVDLLLARHPSHLAITSASRMLTLPAELAAICAATPKTTRPGLLAIARLLLVVLAPQPAHVVESVDAEPLACICGDYLAPGERR